MSLPEIFVNLVNADQTAAWAGIVLVALGGLVALNKVTAALTFVYQHFLQPPISSKRLGPWAVVTGATDGIGKAYCDVLAKKGINILLISRTESKLKDTAAELESKHGIKTSYVAADLTACNDATWAAIQTAVDAVEVGLLINNAGASYHHAEFTDRVDEKLVDDLIEMNMRALTKMCRVALRGMTRRQRGYIVNISSGSGILPSCPLLSIYAATKAYVDHLSRSMDVEYKQFGVRVQSQTPFFIATKLAKIRRTSLTVPSAAVYAKAGVKWIGRAATCNPYWAHDIIQHVVLAIPAQLATMQVCRETVRVFGLPDDNENSRQQVYNLHERLMKAYYRKAQNSGKKET